MLSYTQRRRGRPRPLNIGRFRNTVYPAMGIGVIIHGYIQCPGEAYMPEAKRIYRANRRVILDLPVSDPTWPFITHDMFSLLPLRPSWDRQIAQYENQVIHFAGDYKNMYLLEAGWITKFESLLKGLCWYRAVVMLEFSGFRYEWEVPFEHFGERYRANPPRPPTQWSFQSYRIEQHPLAPDQAIDGPLASPHHVAKKSTTKRPADVSTDNCPSTAPPAGHPDKMSPCPAPIHPSAPRQGAGFPSPSISARSSASHAGASTTTAP